MVQILKPAFLNKGIQLNLIIKNENNESILIKNYYFLIKLILYYLISNSFKNTILGSVNVSISEETDEIIKIDVEDTG